MPGPFDSGRRSGRSGVPGPRRHARAARPPGRCCRPIWPSCGRPSASGRSEARSGRTAAPWRPRFARSRPRDGERSGRRRPYGCRTKARGGPCSWRSIRYASPAVPRRLKSTTRARPASRLSTARSRGRRPLRIRRPPPARQRASWPGRVVRACHRPATKRSERRSSPRPCGRRGPVRSGFR